MWPLTLGKAGSRFEATRTTVWTDGNRSRIQCPGLSVGNAASYGTETVTVPAGTFDTFVLACYQVQWRRLVCAPDAHLLLRPVDRILRQAERPVCDWAPAGRFAGVGRVQLERSAARRERRTWSGRCFRPSITRRWNRDDLDATGRIPRRDAETDPDLQRRGRSHLPGLPKYLSLFRPRANATRLAPSADRSIGTWRRSRRPAIISGKRQWHQGHHFRRKGYRHACGRHCERDLERKPNPTAPRGFCRAEAPWPVYVPNAIGIALAPALLVPRPGLRRRSTAAADSGGDRRW